MKVQEILDLIPEDLLDNIAHETEVNKHVKKLDSKTIFNLFLYSFIEEDRISLRQMNEMFTNIAFTTLNVSNTKTSHTSLSDRLRTIKPVFFERVFESLILNFENLFDNYVKENLIRFDSTIITLSSKLLKGGIPTSTGSKSQIKFSVGYNGLIPKKVKMQTERSHRSEDVCLKEIILDYGIKKDEIAVFDRGLQSRKTFCEFDKMGLFFVSRLGDKAVYKEVKLHEKFENIIVGNLKLELDLLVNLQSFRAKKIDHPFRLIVASKVEDSSKKLYFVSNMHDITAEEIVEIYKRRWDIEVFFKFIKQNLNAKHFISRNLNGIKVTFYMVLILSILLAAYKLLNKLEGYRLPKKRFKEGLKVLLIREIVAFCGGDLDKYDKHYLKLFGQ